MMAEKKDLPLFFIIGRERSGTTLLRMILENHPDVHIPLEASFINYLYPRYGAEKEWTPALLQRFTQDLFTEPYIQFWKADRNALYTYLRNASIASFADACKAVITYSAWLNGKSPDIIGDKNPQYALNVPLLRKIFPGAKFIVLTRDARDQVESMMRVNFERRDRVSLAYRWNYITRKIYRDLRDIQDQTLYLRFEDLLAFPEKELKRITSFLGIPFMPGLFETSEKTADLLRRNMLIDDHHVSLKKALDPSAIFSWKKDASGNSRLVEMIADQSLKIAGYETTGVSDRFILLKHLPSFLYGYLYFPFLKIYNNLPFGLKRWFFQKVIAPKFRFWKESREKAALAERI